MATTYLVCYDLNKEGAAYSAANKRLTDAIKALFSAWWHHLDSTWIVLSDMTAVQIRDALKRHIDDDDELLIVASSGVGAWAGFNPNGASWLQANL